MPWVRSLAAAVVRALAIAQAEDCPIVGGFEQRVVNLLEEARPALTPPPPAATDASLWDRPSEQTVCLKPKAKPGVTAVVGSEARCAQSARL